MIGRLWATTRSATFARHAASLGGGRIVASGLAAVWLVLAARSLSVAAFGDLATLLSVGTILVTLADLGLPFLLADAVARSGRVSRRTIAQVAGRRLLAVAAMAVVVGAAYLLVATDRRLVVPLVFSVSLLATALHSTMTAAMRGLERFSLEASNDVFSRLGVLLVGTVVLRSGGGLLGAVAVYAAADVVSAVVVAMVVARHLSEDDDIDRSSLTARRNVPIAAGRFLSVLYCRVDLWLIALLRGSTGAGTYGASYRFLDAVMLVPRAMGAVAVTHAGRRHREGLRPTSPKSIALAAAGAVAVVAVPCMLFAEQLVHLTFGARYAGAAGILAVLMAAAIPSAVANVLIPLAAVRDGRRFAAVVGGALVVNVLLNLALIPVYGPIAAAWTTLWCQTGLAAALYRLLPATSAGSRPPAPAAEVAALR